MHGALLALMLVAITVDPRLEEPLRLLAQVRDRDGELVGAVYAKVPEVLTLSLAVRKLPAGMDARYDRGRHTVTVAEATMAENPRVVAAILIHELRHAVDLEWVAQRALALDCLEVEARGFEAEAVVTRAFWPEHRPAAPRLSETWQPSSRPMSAAASPTSGRNSCVTGCTGSSARAGRRRRV
jgi:hypothetical protein